MAEPQRAKIRVTGVVKRPVTSAGGEVRLTGKRGHALFGNFFFLGHAFSFETFPVVFWRQSDVKICKLSISSRPGLRYIVAAPHRAQPWLRRSLGRTFEDSTGGFRSSKAERLDFCFPESCAEAKARVVNPQVQAKAWPERFFSGKSLQMKRTSSQNFQKNP